MIQILEDKTYKFDFEHEAISLSVNVDGLVRAELAMESLSTVIISQDNGDELCVICHEFLFVMQW